MMFFKNLTIGAKLITLVVVLELIIVAVSWHGISSTVNTAEKYDNLIKMDTRAAVCANSMGMHLNAARINYHLTMGKTDNSAIEASYAKMKQALADCDRDMAELNSMAQSPEAKQVMASVQKDYEAYKAGTAGTIKKLLDDTVYGH